MSNTEDLEKKRMLEQLMPGAVVQLNPTDHEDGFTGMFMVVDKISGWGVRGYIPTKDGMAYYRSTWEGFAVCGKATWLMELNDGSDQAEELKQAMEIAGDGPPGTHGPIKPK